MPVRKVSNRGGNTIGRFPSTKMGRMIAFESLLERDFIYLLEYEPDVEWFEEQPLKIEYLYEAKHLHYTPDFHLLGCGGRHELVECKPERFIETEENCRKFAVAQEWCERKGWGFRVVTDQDVRRGFRLQNVKLLARYARQKVDITIRSQIHTLLQTTQTPLSIRDLVDKLVSTDTTTVIASVFSLAYHDEISLSLDDAPISEASIVFHRLQKQKDGAQ
jgi:hypothetical protein